jgi:hypothetical protein
MLIASFDIGEKNFAYCIAINETEPTIMKVVHHNVLLKKTQTVVESCLLVSQIINSDHLLMKCDHFIIEQQMRCNTRALRLGQHVWSMLNTLFPKRIVKFVPSYMKTQYFMGRNNLSNKERKKWSVNKVVHEGVMKDNDQHRSIIQEINKMNKKDDICDTILQVLAYVNRNI